MQAQAAESRRRFAMARLFLLCGRAVARRAKVASGYAGQFRCFLREEFKGSLFRIHFTLNQALKQARSACLGAF